MVAKSLRLLTLALSLASFAVSAALAQTDTSSAQPLSLSGTYQLAKVNIGQTAVSMDFTATISNNGGTDVSGQIVLRHPNDISKVFNRFGDQSISAGKTVTVSSSVSVPREIYDGWISGAGPAVFFYTKNERGDIKTYRIGLTATKRPPAPSK
jgi:hypothetical protein